jgi:hypothetical protein
MPAWRFKRIYHMSNASNLALIRRHGLLSTSVLLDLAGVEGIERERLEREQRKDSCRLPNGAVIRDQFPMPPAALSRCLVGGLTPQDWYAELNGRVFFWLDQDRLNRQRRACRSSPQIVLIVDSERLISRYRDQIALTPFNTGSATRKPARRGRGTFVPLSMWLESGWSSEAAALGVPRRTSNPRPAELAVRKNVRDIFDFVVEIRQLSSGQDLSD